MLPACQLAGDLEGVNALVLDAKMFTTPMTSPRIRIGRALTVVKPSRRASAAKLGHRLSGGAREG
jgi:hypothetical protein